MIAAKEELAHDRVYAMRSSRNIGRRGHAENPELRAKLKHECGLQVFHSDCEISEQKELAGLNCRSCKYLLSVDVSQPDGGQLQTGMTQHIALDRHVF